MRRVSFNEDPDIVCYPVDHPASPVSKHNRRSMLIFVGILGSLLMLSLGVVGLVVALTHRNVEVASGQQSSPTASMSQAANSLLPSHRFRSIVSTHPSPPAPLTCQRRETTCHDEDGMVSSCASGDCPCSNDMKKCSSSRFGSYCDEVCCESGVEERCHDVINNIISCIKFADGGCPCPNLGEVKCPFSGECTTICCDDDHQTCFDHATGDPTNCASIIDGGCPCQKGKEKCGGTKDWAGYCVPIGTCCAAGELACVDYDGNKSCKSFSEGCPPNMSYEFWSSMILGTILKNGRPREVSYFYSIRKRMEELAMRNNGDEDLLTMLRGEESELFHTIRLRERRRVFGEVKLIIS